MLTKYLAEARENTPLTATTCIDNPFDLEEATRSFPYHMAIGQKFTSGLINILRSNKVGDCFQSSIYFWFKCFMPLHSSIVLMLNKHNH